MKVALKAIENRQFSAMKTRVTLAVKAPCARERSREMNAQTKTGARGSKRVRTVTTLMRWVRQGLLAFLLVLVPALAVAAPFAAYVMDARTGEVLYQKNADTRLHPASLTKMMTLYLTFQAIERGQVSLDSVVTVTAHAASQPPSRLGLRPGQKIELRYLIRAAAIKSANDAAAAIGDYLGGDEAGFAAKMNAMAKSMGMKNTTFRNANGLTREGHMSTAHDMSILGRHVLYDFPQYYNLFSRRTADAGIAKVANTNRRFLDAYEGADGIKTGYTVPAGFNLVASAQRGNKRIIATMFGGTSTAQRNAKVAELLDLGFARAPGNVTPEKPEPPAVLMANNDVAGPEVTGASIADSDEGDDDATPVAEAKRIIVALAPDTSPRPSKRPGVGRDKRAAIEMALADAAAPLDPAAPAEVAELQNVNSVVAQAAQGDSPRPTAAQRSTTGFTQVSAPQPETLAMIDPVNGTDDEIAQGDTDPTGPVFVQSATPQPETLAMTGAKRNDTVILAALTPPAPAQQKTREVVARASSSGGRNYGINLGKYASQYAAERALMKTALMESDTLGDALRKVATRKPGYEANFVGLTQQGAQLACARLSARGSDCTVIGP